MFAFCPRAVAAPETAAKHNPGIKTQKCVNLECCRSDCCSWTVAQNNRAVFCAVHGFFLRSRRALIHVLHHRHLPAPSSRSVDKAAATAWHAAPLSCNCPCTYTACCCYNYTPRQHTSGHHAACQLLHPRSTSRSPSAASPSSSSRSHNASPTSRVRVPRMPCRSLLQHIPLIAY